MRNERLKLTIFVFFFPQKNINFVIFFHRQNFESPKIQIFSTHNLNQNSLQTTNHKECMCTILKNWKKYKIRTSKSVANNSNANAHEQEQKIKASSMLNITHEMHKECLLYHVVAHFWKDVWYTVASFNSNSRAWMSCMGLKKRSKK